MGVTVVEGPPPFRRQVLEPYGVDLERSHAEGVTGCFRDKHGRRCPWRPIGFEHPAEVRDVGLQRGRRGLGWRLPPELVDETIDRDDLVQVDEEHREDGALARRAEIDSMPGGINDLQRSEHSEVPRAAALRHGTEILKECGPEHG
jgi:hypothetical protein